MKNKTKELIKQKLWGVLGLITSIGLVFVVENPIVAVILLPLSLCLLCSGEELIIGEYPYNSDKEQSEELA